MKYDLTKCNNLRWRADGNIGGFIRYYGGEAALISDEKTLTCNGLVNDGVCCDSIEEVEDYIEDRLPGFEIVPRDPETYKDWLVGDTVQEETGARQTVHARINDIIFVVGNGTDIAIEPQTCDELYNNGFRLVLTDYEKSLDERSTKCPFKKGDRVLVRHGDEFPWTMRVFHEFKPNDRYHYWIFAAGAYAYEQCIPYNEKTWKLLGTTDNYKKK